jgi:hypothetical protein
MSVRSLTDFFKQTFHKIFASKQAATGINAIFLGDDHILHVIEQPVGRPEYISTVTGTVTNFQLAAQYGNIGLIAHNNLGGRYFNDLRIGDRVYTMNGYQGSQAYEVSEILHFRAINPKRSNTDFIDLDSNEHYSANDVFQRVYTGSHHLVLQTCIERNADTNWGRLFVLAEPVV